MIEFLLRNYNYNKSRLKALTCGDLPDQVKYIHSTSVIELAGGNSVRGKSSIVETAGIKLEELQKEARAEIRRLQSDLQTVEILLEGLGTVERFVIENLYFEELDFNRLSEKFFSEFNCPLTNRALQGNRRKALEKMKAIVRA